MSKLASKYNPENYKMPNNGHYLYFQDLLLDHAWIDPKQKDPSREEITDVICSYELSENEKNFYEKLYTPHGELVNDPIFLQKYGLGDRSCSEHIKDIIDFINNPTAVICDLIGPKGAGKSVLLKTFSLFLFSNNDWLQENVIPILITVDLYKSLIKKQISDTKKINFFHHKILQEPIVKVVKVFTKLENDEFWEFLKASGYNTLSQLEEDIIQVERKKDKARRKIFKERKKARKIRDFYFSALKYIKEVKQRTPLIILDNVDTLDIETIALYMDEVLRIAIQYNLKIIISFRNETYQKFRANYNPNMEAYRGYILAIPLKFVETKNYIDNNARNVIDMMELKKPSAAIISPRNVAVSKVTYANAARVFESMHKTMLDDERVNFLKALSGNNLRKLNTLINTYVRSGFVDEKKFMTTYLKDIPESELRNISPLWVLLSSLITSNHKTRFSQDAHSTSDSDILNVYCNGKISVNSPGNYILLRILLLRFLSRQHENINITVLKDKCREVLQIDEPSFTRAIVRMFQVEAIVSPDLYVLEEEKDVDKIKEIRITDIGMYYLYTLRTYYEYIVYMKDDVDLGENTENILDCIECSNLIARLEQVYKFLKYLKLKELEFFIKIQDNGKGKEFQEYFCDSQDGYWSCLIEPLNRLIMFINSKAEAEVNNEQIDNKIPSEQTVKLNELEAKYKELLSELMKEENYRKQEYKKNDK